MLYNFIKVCLYMYKYFSSSICNKSEKYGNMYMVLARIPVRIYVSDFVFLETRVVRGLII